MKTRGGKTIFVLFLATLFSPRGDGQGKEKSLGEKRRKTAARNRATRRPVRSETKNTVQTQTKGERKDGAEYPSHHRAGRGSNNKEPTTTRQQKEDIVDIAKAKNISARAGWAPKARKTDTRTRHRSDRAAVTDAEQPATKPAPTKRRAKEPERRRGKHD